MPEINYMHNSCNPKYYIIFALFLHSAKGIKAFIRMKR